MSSAIILNKIFYPNWGTPMLLDLNLLSMNEKQVNIQQIVKRVSQRLTKSNQQS